MKNRFQNICRAALAMTFTFAMTGCDDYLEVKPLNEICFDNYWDEKADVESIVFGCYSGLQSKDMMTRIGLWGDCRSEDYEFNTSGDNDIRQIAQENILETNKYMNWLSLYTVINRCNTVIYYAPGVAAIDPNYSDSELRANIAEVTWIRSLCYFYLARTFKDVPYSTKPSMNDNNIDEDYRIKVTPFKDLLKQLVKDLEAVKDDAVRYYPPMVDKDNRITNAYNTSRVTVCAMNALLADIYLWLDDYEKVLEYTQKVLDYKIATLEDVRTEFPNTVRDIKMMKNKYPLILEKEVGSTTGGNAFTQIFGTGNSFESIFELYFDRDKNELTNTFFYNNSNSGAFKAGKTVSDGKFFKYTDGRGYVNFQKSGTVQAISKYYFKKFSYVPLTKEGEDLSYGYSSTSGDSYANWKIYRLTEVMLMRAEALIELGGEENLKEAFEIIYCINLRANCLEEGADEELKEDQYTDQSELRKLVREERHKELMYEGKRWYDWVRYCLRDGSTADLIEAVRIKHDKLAAKVSVQLKADGALFWPYAEREVDLNENIKQNPAYLTTETSAK